MSISTRIASFWRTLRHRDQVDRDLDAEVQATFELLVDEKIRAGVPTEEAGRAATLELGGVEVIKQQVREERSGAFVDGLLQDVRYGARTLRGSPLFTLVAVLSLAIGITGTTVIFTLAEAYLLRARPGIADPARLWDVGRTDTGEHSDPSLPSGVDQFSTFSYPNYLDYRERQMVFAGLAAYRENVTFGLGTDADATPVSGGYVSANYFAVLGVAFPLGRGFLPEEERAGSPNTVAVISDRLWHRQFAGDRDVVGRTIRLNGRPFTIVGVAGPGFNGYTIAAENVWIPLTAYPDGNDLRRLTARGQQWLMGIGRLKDGVMAAQARTEMARIARDLEREYPEDNRGDGVGVEASGAVPVTARSVIKRFIALLFALVGLILLIACTNVAGMLLGRGAARAREIAVRLALGAERRRIARLLVIESLLLAIPAAIVGLAATAGSLRLVERVLPLFRIEVAWDAGINWRVMTFAITVATLTGVACGLVPALAAGHVDLASSIKRDHSGGMRPLRARQTFVVVQIALSTLLVVCAALLGRSIHNASTIDPGFLVNGVDVVGLDLQLGGYDTRTGPRVAATLMAQVESLPGVEAAASAFVVPLTMETEGGRVWLPEERGDDRAIPASWNVVTPGYFRAIELPLIDGRSFDMSDGAGAPLVAIVNETFARRAWRGKEAVGQQLVVGVSRRPLHIVGVARDAKYRTIGERPTPFIYVPAAQRYEQTMWLLLRSKGPSMVSQVRALVHDMDPNLPVTRAATLTDMTAFGLFPQRLSAGLAGVASVIGMLLAALGVYGVMAYNVSRRIREISIRVALGAQRGQMLRLLLGYTMILAAVGTMLGLVTAVFVTRLLEGLLYDIKSLDPVSFAGAAMMLVTIALIASLIPARRALCVDPVEALRAE
jgi:predicted permease